MPLVTSMQSAPSGLLRISVATDFGVNLLSPILGDFLLEYPDITVNMVLNNRYVELISEGFDMAIRVGELEDSSLRARKLTDTAKRMIGSPGYFQKHGRPLKIDDLNEHKLLHYSNQANGNVWKVTAPSGEKRQVRTAGWLTVNDGQCLLNAAVSGSWHRLSALVPLCRCDEAAVWSKRPFPACRSKRSEFMRFTRRDALPNRKCAPLSTSLHDAISTRGQSSGNFLLNEGALLLGRGAKHLDPSVFGAARLAAIIGARCQRPDPVRADLRRRDLMALDQPRPHRGRPLL